MLHQSSRHEDGWDMPSWYFSLTIIFSKTVSHAVMLVLYIYLSYVSITFSDVTVILGARSPSFFLLVITSQYDTSKKGGDVICRLLSTSASWPRWTYATCSILTYVIKFSIECHAILDVSYVCVEFGPVGMAQPFNVIFVRDGISQVISILGCS
jgi:hypothetical protein